MTHVIQLLGSSIYHGEINGLQNRVGHYLGGRCQDERDYCFFSLLPAERAYLDLLYREHSNDGN